MESILEQFRTDRYYLNLGFYFGLCIFCASLVAGIGNLYFNSPWDLTIRCVAGLGFGVAITYFFYKRLNRVVAPDPSQMNTPVKGKVIINGFMDNLYCVANPFPFRGDVYLFAHMPGGKHYTEVLDRANGAVIDHYKALAHWKDTCNPSVEIAPTLFVFVALSTDPAFRKNTGLTVGYLFHSMEALATQFIGHCNQSTHPPTTVLDRLDLIPVTSP